MGKTAYKVAVAGVSIVIAPDLTKTDAPDWVEGQDVVVGDYVKNPANGMTYWAVTAGYSTVIPAHLHGIEVVEDIDWMALPNNREMIISSDEAGNCYATKGGLAIIGEGMRFDGYRPAWDLEKYSGPVSAIADGSVTLAIEFTAG